MRADVVDGKYFEVQPDDSLAFVFFLQLTTLAGFAVGARWAFGNWAEALLFSYCMLALAFGFAGIQAFAARRRAEFAYRISVLVSQVEKKTSRLGYTISAAQHAAEVALMMACAALVWPLLMGGMATHQAVTSQADIQKLDPRAVFANPLYNGIYFAFIAVCAYALAVPLKIESVELKIFLGLNLLALTLNHLRTILGPYSMLDNVRLIYTRPRLVFFTALILDLLALVLLLPVVARGLFPHEVGLADLRQSLASLYFHEDLLTLLTGGFEWKSFISTSVGLCFDVAALQLVVAGLRSKRSDEDWLTLSMEQVMRGDSAGARASIANVKERSPNVLRQEAMIAFSEGIFYEGVAKIIDAQELRKKYSHNRDVAYLQAMGMVAAHELDKELWLRFLAQAEVDLVSDEALVGIAHSVIVKGLSAKDLIKEKQGDNSIDEFATKYPVTFAVIFMSAFLVEKKESEAKALVEMYQSYGGRYKSEALTVLARIAWPDLLELAIMGEINAAALAAFHSHNRDLIANCSLYLYTYDGSYIGLHYLHRINTLLKEHKLLKESAEIEAVMHRLLPFLEFHGGTQERELMEAVMQISPEATRAVFASKPTEKPSRHADQSSPA